MLHLLWILIYIATDLVLSELWSGKIMFFVTQSQRENMGQLRFWSTKTYSDQRQVFCIGIFEHTFLCYKHVLGVSDPGKSVESIYLISTVLFILMVNIFFLFMVIFVTDLQLCNLVILHYPLWLTTL